MDTDEEHAAAAEKAFRDITDALETMRQNLWDLAFHDAPLDEGTRESLEGDLLDAINSALAERMRRRSRFLAESPMTRQVTLGEIVARSIKRLRVTAELTQEGLAEHMQKLGFVTWKRITVAEVESGKRRLGLEEMIGIAILFQVPLGHLLGSFNPDEVLEMNERVVLTSAQAQELITGWPMDHAWNGIWILPSMASAATFNDQSSSYDWRPAGDDGFFADTIEGEYGQMLLYFPGYM